MIKAASPDEACLLRGYASLFAQPDLSGDIIEQGAFTASLNRRSQIAMLWQHQPDRPVGLWTTVRQDHHGLYVEGSLVGGVKAADEAQRLIAAGALDGLSIGFRTIRSKISALTGKRHILEADLWEISLVTFPMLLQARLQTLQPEQTAGTACAAIIRRAAAKLSQCRLSLS